MINKYDESKAFDYENGFYLTSPVYRMSNILSHYELYKRIIELPGDVVELGVFKGASFLQFCSFREILENENARKIIGFDMFGECPEAQNDGDRKFRNNWIKEVGNDYLTSEELQKALDYKKIGNTELIKGDICETVPQYVKEHPFLKIALLHIDVDIYEPALVGLKYLYEKIIPGGGLYWTTMALQGKQTR
jgi:hypothetical protein